MDVQGDNNETKYNAGDNEDTSIIYFLAFLTSIAALNSSKVTSRLWSLSAESKNSATSSKSILYLLILYLCI